MLRDLVRAGLSEVERREKFRAALAVKYGGAGSMAASGTTALLLDRTGSMWGRSLELLNEAVRDFKDIRRFSYAGDITELAPGELVRNAYGRNNEPGAFRYLKGLGITHIVMVTDGRPDDEEESLEAAKGLKVDIIYIGPPPEPEFLRRLASLTGGTYNRAEIKLTAELTAAVRGLLPTGEPEAGSKGAICL